MLRGGILLRALRRFCGAARCIFGVLAVSCGVCAVSCGVLAVFCGVLADQKPVFGILVSRNIKLYVTLRRGMAD